MSGAAAVKEELDLVPFQDEHAAHALEWIADLQPAARAIADDGDRLAAAARALEVFRADEANQLFVFLLDGEPTGMCAVMVIDRDMGVAELAFVLDRSARGRGYGRLVGQQFVEGCFRAGFRNLRVMCASQESVNMCKRIGFRPVGAVPMQLTAQEWRNEL